MQGMWVGAALWIAAAVSVATVGVAVAGPGGEAIWTSYRDFTFNDNSDDIRGSDGAKPREIAEHVGKNPFLRVGLDGANPRRVATVRNALLTAGVPARNIEVGDVGEPQLRRDGLVVVMVSR
jgi:outer membrane protein OmpA-like peptidoglycan-associated protein